MLDIGWSELLMIAVVTIVVVGPKDLPRVLRTVGRTIAQMRKLAGEFTSQFNDALREAEFDELNKSIKELKNSNPLKDVEKDLREVKDGLNSSLKDVPGSIAKKSTSGGGEKAASGGTAANPQAADKKSGEMATGGGDKPVKGSPLLSGAGGLEPGTVLSSESASPVVQRANAAVGPNGTANSAKSDSGAGEPSRETASGAAPKKGSVAERAAQSWKSAVGDESGA